jgi:hypothetical protein
MMREEQPRQPITGAGPEPTRTDVTDPNLPPLATRESIRQGIAALAVATAHPTTRTEFIRTAPTDELMDELVRRGDLVEEWHVGLRSVTDPTEVLGRWAMSSQAQAAGVCRDWREESGGANYVVERHLGATIFVVVPDVERITDANGDELENGDPDPHPHA